MNGQSGAWFEFARMDLHAAEYLLNMHPVPIEIICYHCEQAAEKMLKGVLVSYNSDPPKTHDLVLLCKRCAEADARFDALLESCMELTPYGVQVRYPSMLDLDESDMRCAIKESRSILAFVEQMLQSLPACGDTARKDDSEMQT